MRKLLVLFTFLLTFVLITNQSLTAAEQESPVKKLNISLSGGGLVSSSGGIAGHTGLKLNYFVKENLFLSPQLLVIDLRLFMPGIMINKIIKNSFFVGAGGFYIGNWEYKDVFLKFQAGKMLKRLEISGFVMAPLGVKALLFGVSVGILLKNY